PAADRSAGTPAATAQLPAPPGLRIPAGRGCAEPCGHGSPPPPRHSRYSGARRPATGSAPTPASGDLLATRGASLLPDIPPSHPAGTYNPIRPRSTPVCCLRHQQFCRVGRVPLPQLGEEPLFLCLETG